MLGAKRVLLSAVVIPINGRTISCGDFAIAAVCSATPRTSAMAELARMSISQGVALPPVSVKIGATIERPIKTPAMKLAAGQGRVGEFFMMQL